MRLRIRYRLEGSIEGVPLDDFQAGAVYDLGVRLARVFLTHGWAEPIEGDEGASRFGVALVLVVDDDTDLRQFTKFVLTSNGYDVLEARHGQEAIERLRERVPDLVVLDLDMPVMDGWQFRAAQQGLPDGRLAAVPVLLLTGAVGCCDHAAALKVAGLVEKPFEPDRLLVAVESVLRR